MAVIDNRTTEVGDVLYIESDIPVIGVTTLTGFVDDTVVESGTPTYNKRYQLSRNGVSWSDWKDLTIENLQGEDISSYDKIFIRYKYKQEADGSIRFNSSTLQGTYDSNALDPTEPYYFRQSIFIKYFSFYSLDVLRWYVNITEKLYQGELNKYLKFDDGEGNSDDAIFFWQSIGKFFAFYVILARTYKDFYKNEEVLNKYLLNRGLFTTPANTLEELQALMKNFNQEVSKRGTRNILNKKQNGFEYDGELRRYLALTGEEEFIFNYFLPQHCGWWIDNSSPMYRGLEDHLNANKLTIDNLTTSGAVSVNEVSLNDTQLTFTGAGEVAFSDEEKLINVDTRQAYVVEFLISVSSATTLSVGLNCYSENNSLITNGTLNMKTNSSASSFLSEIELNRFAEFPDTYFPVKCVVFSIDKSAPFSQDETNIGVGNNLKFNPEAGVKKIYPTIEVDGNAIIKDLNFRPLATQYGRGFINMNHFIQLDYSSPEHNSRIVTELLDNFYDPIHTNEDESILVNT